MGEYPDRTNVRPRFRGLGSEERHLVYCGAYGLCVSGLDALDGALLPVPDDWPCLRVRREARIADDNAPEPGTIDLDDRKATLWILHGDRIDIDRRSLEVIVATTAPLP